MVYSINHSQSWIMTLFLPTLWSIFADLGGWFLDVLRSWLFFHAWNVPKGHRSDVKIQPTRSCQKVWGNMSFITTGWECQICVYCHLGWQLQWNIHVAYRLIYIYIYMYIVYHIHIYPGSQVQVQTYMDLKIKLPQNPIINAHIP